MVTNLTLTRTKQLAFEKYQNSNQIKLTESTGRRCDLDSADVAGALGQGGDGGEGADCEAGVVGKEAGHEAAGGVASAAFAARVPSALGADHPIAAHVLQQTKQKNAAIESTQRAISRRALGRGVASRIIYIANLNKATCK